MVPGVHLLSHFGYSVRPRRVPQSIRAVLKEMPLVHAFDAFALVKGFLQFSLESLALAASKATELGGLLFLVKAFLPLGVASPTCGHVGP